MINDSEKRRERKWVVALRTCVDEKLFYQYESTRNTVSFVLGGVEDVFSSVNKMLMNCRRKKKVRLQ